LANACNKIGKPVTFCEITSLKSKVPIILTQAQ
jgi:hypothetical protein